MGYSIRNASFRYTVWLPWDSDTDIANWSSSNPPIELYDHRFDNGSGVGALEIVNLAREPDYATDVAALHSTLEAFAKKYTADLENSNAAIGLLACQSLWAVLSLVAATTAGLALWL